MPDLKHPPTEEELQDDPQLEDEGYEEEPIDEEEYQQDDLEDDDPEGQDDDEYTGGMFTFTVTDDNGDEVDREFSEDDLKKLVEKSQDFEEIEQRAALADKLMPLVQLMDNSELMQNTLYYKQQGYTDEQIAEAIFKHYGVEEQDTTEQTKEYDNIQDEIRDIVSQVMKERLGPVEKELNMTKEQQTLQATQSHNDMVFADALRSHDYDPSLMNKGQQKKIVKTINELYPNEDYSKYQFSKAQANHIINTALGRRKGAKKASSQARNIARQASADRVIPGNSPGARQNKGKGKSPQQNAENIVSFTQRISNWGNLFKDKG